MSSEHHPNPADPGAGETRETRKAGGAGESGGALEAASLGVHGTHLGADRRGPVVDPIFQSATFFGGRGESGHDLLYTRYGNNPNQLAVAAKLAALEGTEAGLALSSGMAALAMTLLSLTEAGDHVVASRHLYGATHALLATEMPRRGVETTFIEPAGEESWVEAAEPTTRLLLMEVVTNPLMRVFDPRPAARAAARLGVPLLADLTFACPVNLRGVDVGVDLCMHSATKYLGGHSDLIAGVVSGPADLVAGVQDAMKLYGPAIDPHSAWLLDRGLKTLVPRVEAHNRNAMALAAWLEGQPGVAGVAYPGLPSHPDHALAVDLLAGFGGMLGLELEGGAPSADAFCSALEVACFAPSLGGVETLVSQPRLTSHAGFTTAEREALGIGDGYVRISVGIEGVNDLKADFARGLAAARNAVGQGTGP
jgi:cystathionine beta-lyase/cystathionine gamma-synthase